MQFVHHFSLSLGLMMMRGVRGEGAARLVIGLLTARLATDQLSIGAALPSCQSWPVVTIGQSGPGQWSQWSPPAVQKYRLDTDQGTDNQ